MSSPPHPAPVDETPVAPLPGLLRLSEDHATIVEACERSLAILGLSGEDVRDQSLSRVLRLGLTSGPDGVVARLLAGELIEHDWRVPPAKQGKLLRLSLRSPADREPQVLVEDLTPWRQVRTALAIAHERLEQVDTRSLREAAHAPLVHDLNNLLTEMFGESFLATQRGSDRDARQSLERIRPLVERAARLVRRVRRRSQPAECALGYCDAYCDANTAIRELAPILRRALGERSSLELTLSEQLCLVALDTDSLERVLLNLVLNARDALNARGGKVTIATERQPDGSSVLTVCDTGHGMSELVAERALEPLFTTKVGGTGVGLASVDRLVSRVGGQLQIESVVDQGTTIRIVLPRRPEAGSEEGRGR